MTTIDSLFAEQIGNLLGAEQAADLLRALEHSEPSVSVRVNERRGAQVPAGADRVPWCPQGFYCIDRPAFTFDVDHHAGMYYVQDASSMFIAHVIRNLVDAPVRYLDLCAAPGGKTTAAVQALPEGSLVVANEYVAGRARVLADNVMRWGSDNVVVTNAAPAALGRLTHHFDVVAADVPCSGEGMMRKDDEAVAQWSPALVEQCAARQRSILDDVWPALRPGGLMIYSTCTFNLAENEQMVNYLIEYFGAEPVAVPIQDEWHIAPAIDSPFPAYRFMPHLTRGEGLFMAVLRKPDEPAARPAKARRDNPVAMPAELRQWLMNAQDMMVTRRGDELHAIGKQWAPDLALLGNLNVLSAGVPLAVAKGKGWMPHQALAWNVAAQRGAWPVAEVDYPTALAYLRGEAVVIDAPRGYVLLTHRGRHMGFVNNLGNRANNLYPKPLRILTSHLPDTPPTIL